MDNINTNSYQGVIMKEMTLDRMEMIEGGSWLRCGLGTVGMAILGGLAGTGEEPGGGTILGIIGGGMYGYAEFCMS